MLDFNLNHECAEHRPHADPMLPTGGEEISEPWSPPPSLPESPCAAVEERGTSLNVSISLRSSSNSMFYYATLAYFYFNKKIHVQKKNIIFPILIHKHQRHLRWN